MKKLFTILFATMLAGQAWAAANYDFSAKCSSGQTLYYKITSSTAPYAAQVVYPNNSDYSNYNYNGYTKPTGTLTIPEKVTYNEVEYVVTSVGGSTFSGCSGLKSVTIPESVISIGHSAFDGCNSLTSVTIPNSVISIGNAAFRSCNSLTSVIIPESITSIGEGAFKNSDLKTVYFNAQNCGTMSGSTPVFEDCNSFNVIIGDNVESIPSYAFYNCSGLKSVTIPNSVKTIGNSAFSGCNSLTSMSISSDADFRIAGLHITKEGFCYHVLNKSSVEVAANKYTGYIVIPTTVTFGSNTYNITGIGDNAFYGCSGLTSVTIPNSVTSIGERTFYDCSGLTSITIPNSVTSIGSSAFSGCDKITSVITECDADLADAKLCFSQNKIVYHVLNKTTVDVYDLTASINLEYHYTGDIVIPENIIAGNTFVAKRINEKLFEGCSSITSISIPNSITSIGQNAFKGCSSLASINIPNSVTSIGDDAFSGCGNLDYTLYKGGKYIGSEENPYMALIGVNSADIASVEINDECKFICDNAFRNCTKLANASIPNSIISIGKDSFYGCKSLTSIIVPNTVTYIGSGAFSGCASLNSISLPFVGDKPHIATDTYQYPLGVIFGTNNYTGSIKVEQSYIGKITNSSTTGYYYIPSSLTEVIITESSYIPYGAFSGCGNLVSISIPSNVTDIMNCAFSYCSRLEAIIIPESVISIGNDAFKYCRGLTSVTIPNSVTSIGSNAFFHCDSLTTINLSNSVTRIGYSAFESCGALSSLTITKSVIDIGTNAFRNCNGLNSIVIESDANLSNANLKFKKDSIEYYVLDKNTVKVASSSKMNKIQIPKTVVFGNTFTVTGIGSDAFKNRIDLIIVSVPNSVESIENNAFYGCNNLSTINIPNSVESIGNDAFYGCNKLNAIAIPASVTEIGENAFKESANQVFCLSTTPITLSTDPFPNNDTIFVSAQCVNAYKTSAIWKRKEIMPYYSVSATSANEDFGIVECFGYCGENSSTTIKAVPANGYHFVSWNDGNKNASRKLSAAQNVTLTATFGVHIAETDVSVAATCTETGLTEGSHCSVCGEILVAQETIPMVEHTIVVDDAVAATCTQTGKTEGSHCSGCGLVFAAQEEIPALGHTEVVDYAVAATCTETGLTEGKHCSVCNAVLVAQEEIPANGHTEVVDKAIAATCTKTGKTEGKHCSVCNAVLVKQDTIPALGHTIVTDTAVAATCTKTGLTEGKHCSVCNAVIVEQTEIPMVEHTIVTDAAVAATATETGLTEGSHCSVCGAVIVEQVVIPALGEQGSENQGGNNEGSENQGGNNEGNENQGGNNEGNENQGGNENNPGTAVAESAAGNLQVYAHHNTIIVENATDEIRVYNAMGALVGRDVIHRVRAELQVNGAGVYIVKVGAAAKRVMIND